MTDRTCSAPDCEDPLYGRTWCRRHARRMREHGSLEIPPKLRCRDLACKAPDCERTVYALELCRAHWVRMRTYGQLERPAKPPFVPPPCSMDGCDLPMDSRGLCMKHYVRLRKHGDPTITLVRERTGIRTCAKCGASPDDVPFRLDKKAPDGYGAYCKPCSKIYAAAQYRANREQWLADCARRYRQNRERYRAAQDRYRQANIDRIRAYDRERARGNPVNIERARQWRLDNLDRYRAVSHAWYMRNQHRVRAASLAWRSQNPERYRQIRCEMEARRRARKRGQDGKILFIDRHGVWRRDRGRCGVCGDFVPFRDMHLDHIKPLSKGGRHELANVQTTHSVCNLRKNSLEGPEWAFETASRAIGALPAQRRSRSRRPAKVT